MYRPNLSQAPKVICLLTQWTTELYDYSLRRCALAPAVLARAQPS